ncbi:DMT family transporter [Streptomyces sp. WAC 00631]|uniref:DMT family transporter n=1 Tax=Streptomyces sp. WAC 00631 TaxID=2203201 RepID=UPI000F76BFC1|nr:DMT family transporter [Streptomyces sp. WAC 00631]MCC5036639.1 DMT family transporter [Streptomyces sp. WAC 00631]
MLVAIPAALAAGLCFALAGVLQQRSASARPADEFLSFRLLLDLARKPLWVSGIALAVLAYGCQGLALAYAPLTLVQPLIVSELLFAIPLSALVLRMRLRRREWCGVLAVSTGLVTALAAARPRPAEAVADPGAWLVMLAGVGAAAAAALVAGRHAGGTAKASLIALAAGLVMGTQSVLLAATVERFDGGAAAVFTAWQTYLLVGASIGGLLLIQSAFQAGPLAASMPVMDAVEPAVAIAAGVTLFGESVRTGWPAGGVALAGLLLLFAGIVLLDTSPLLKALYRRETAGRAPGEAGRAAGGGNGPGAGRHRGRG